MRDYQGDCRRRADRDIQRRPPERSFTRVDDIVEGVMRTVDEVGDEVATANPVWNCGASNTASNSALHRIYNLGNEQPVELLRHIEVLDQCSVSKADIGMLLLPADDMRDCDTEMKQWTASVDYPPSVLVEEGVSNFDRRHQGYRGSAS